MGYSYKYEAIKVFVYSYKFVAIKVIKIKQRDRLLVFFALVNPK